MREEPERRKPPRTVRLGKAGAGVAAALVLVGTLLFLEAGSVARIPQEGSSGATPPVRIYARPPVLALGRRLDPMQLEEHLRRIGYTRVDSDRVEGGEYAPGRREWRIGARPIAHLGSLGAELAFRVRLDSWGRIRSIEGADGERYRVVPLEPELVYVWTRGGGRGGDRVRVELDQMPDHLRDAILAVEDGRFLTHRGLDFWRIGAAALANLRHGEIVQGGSTITQQLARTLFLDGRRTWVRKAREAAMALVLERRYSKDEIFEAYLNEIYLGHESGLAVRGVGRASEVLFGKDVRRLDLAEAALLAGVIRAPALYDPARHPEAARARRSVVLRQMADRGMIDEAERAEAESAPLPSRAVRGTAPPARYFVDHLIEQLEASGEVDADASAGGAVITSLDADLQRSAAAAVSAGLSDLERSHDVLRSAREEGGSGVQAALVALDPRTGHIVAMVGGRDYGNSQFNRAAHARRQPGSSFKPIVALSALTAAREVGEPDIRESPYTLATVLPDEPLEVDTPAGPWRPVNYDGRYRGAVSLREALERSLNVPFARLGLDLGPERIVRTARQVGIESPLLPYPSLALGAFEVTPLEMAQAYAVLASGGVRHPTGSVLGVVDADGTIRVREGEAGVRVATPAETYLVTSALRGAVARGTGRGLEASGFSGDVAAKSGTTNGFRDGWFIGYSPSLVVAVWVGFDDGRDLGLSGARVALPIFARFMAAATGHRGDEGVWGSQGFEIPSGLVAVEVDPETGLRAGPGCRGRTELFLRGTEPWRSCSPYGYSIAGRSARERYDLLRRLGELRSRRSP